MINTLKTLLNPKMVVAVATAIVLSACTSNPHKDSAESEPPLKRIEIRKVGLIRALDAAGLTAENRGAALHFLGFVGTSIQRNIEKNRGNDLETLFDVREFKPGKELSEALLAELRARGFNVEYITSAPRNVEDVTEIDFAAIDPLADAFIQIQIDEMGLYSGATTTKYHPRFNVDIEMLVEKGEEEIFAQSIEYGVDASELNDESIPADPKYAYASFGDAYEHGDELISAFREGIALIAQSIARQIDEKQLVKKQAAVNTATAEPANTITRTAQ